MTNEEKSALKQENAVLDQKVLTIVQGGAGSFREIVVKLQSASISYRDLLEKFRAVLEISPHEYAVGFTEVRRADQPLEGGWRWHKWGEYIGARIQRCEYLHDEPEIESVVTFSVVRRAA